MIEEQPTDCREEYAKGDVVQLQMCLANEDILGLFSYYLVKKHMSMLGVDTMVMFSRLLLKEGILKMFSYYLRMELISMLMVDIMTIRSRLLLRKDI
jgi:hypothetical protein